MYFSHNDHALLVQKIGRKKLTVKHNLSSNIRIRLLQSSFFNVERPCLFFIKTTPSASLPTPVPLDKRLAKSQVVICEHIPFTHAPQTLEVARDRVRQGLKPDFLSGT